MRASAGFLLRVGGRFSHVLLPLCSPGPCALPGKGLSVPRALVRDDFSARGGAAVPQARGGAGGGHPASSSAGPSAQGPLRGREPRALPPPL